MEGRLLEEIECVRADENGELVVLVGAGVGGAF